MSVGQVTVGAGGGDFFSRADYRVEIRRQDASVLGKVGELEDRMDRWQETSAQFRSTMAPLMEKQRLSEPGPEFTGVERRRLIQLQRLRLEEASAEDIRELHVLTEKRERSEVRPGPPLTRGELATLEELNDSVGVLETRISRAEDERRTLLDAITGYTATVDSDEKTVHFGLRRVLTIYPEDDLVIRVVDVDVFDDDTYGVHRLRVTAELLRAGALELGPTPDRRIRALELNFRPADSRAC